MSRVGPSDADADVGVIRRESAEDVLAGSNTAPLPQQTYDVI